MAFCCLGVSEAKANKIPIFAQAPNIDMSLWRISHGTSNGHHQSCEWRSNAFSAQNGNLAITLEAKKSAQNAYICGALQTKQRYGFGRYEVRMRTAAGDGLNTAFFTYIGKWQGVKDHDEIDFEFLGKDPTTVQLNFWRKGKTATPKTIKLGFDASADFHDYAFEWTRNKISWYADGKLIYETQPWQDIPQNPGLIFLSLWAGSPVMDDWLGQFNYTKPVTAQIAWVKFTPESKVAQQ